jgi:hypothetical protein
MSAFALLIPPANLTVHLQRLTERSPTVLKALAASVCSLSPVKSSARADSTSELLRTL